MQLGTGLAADDSYPLLLQSSLLDELTQTKRGREKVTEDFTVIMGELRVS